MNQDDMYSRSDWYRPDADGRPSNEHPPSSPADAVLNSTHISPPRSAGLSSHFTEPYWSVKEPAPTAPPKRRSVYRIAALCFLVVAIIAVTAVIFSDGHEEPPPAHNGAEDYRDFFDKYYGGDSAHPNASTSIPRAPLGAGVQMELVGTPDGEELSLQEIYDKCIPSIVSITANVDSVRYYWGTGVVLTEDGYIITNTHVIEGVSSVTVTMYDDTQYEALLVGADSVSDLTVLKIEASGLIPAEFGDSSQLSVGDRVVAIGNPLGERFRGTMTDGIISAINRDMNYNNHSMTLLQTNAAINEGNSGGPLINMHGQVIGITNMKMISTSLYPSIEGIGFAIPTSTMKSIIDSLIQDGAVSGRPALGVTVGPIPASASDYYRLPAGLYVSAVSPGSDSEAKGIVVGDIITAANGTPVATTLDLSAAMDGLQAGDAMTLTIYHNGETYDLEVKLVETSDLY